MIVMLADKIRDVVDTSHTFINEFQRLLSEMNDFFAYTRNDRQESWEFRVNFYLLPIIVQQLNIFTSIA